MSNTDFWMRLKNLLLSLIIGSGAFNLLVISAIRCRPPRLLKSWYIGQFFLIVLFSFQLHLPSACLWSPKMKLAVWKRTQFFSSPCSGPSLPSSGSSSSSPSALATRWSCSDFCEQGNKCDLKGGDLGGKRNSGVHSCHDLDQVWRWCSKLPYSVLSRLVLLILIFSFLSLITSAKVRDRKTQQGN